MGGFVECGGDVKILLLPVWREEVFSRDYTIFTDDIREKIFHSRRPSMWNIPSQSRLDQIPWKGTIQQYAGRLHRQYDGKKEVRIYDYLDDSVPMLARMYKRRLRGYKAIGYEIMGPETIP